MWFFLTYDMELFCHLNFLWQNIFNIKLHFSNFQIDIFCHFNSSHKRWNGLFFMFVAVKTNYNIFSIIMETLWWHVGMCLVKNTWISKNKTLWTWPIFTRSPGNQIFIMFWFYQLLHSLWGWKTFQSCFRRIRHLFGFSS